MKLQLVTKLSIVYLCLHNVQADDMLTGYKEPLITQNLSHETVKNSSYSNSTADAYGIQGGQYYKYESLVFLNNYTYAYAYTTDANTFDTYSAYANAYGGALWSVDLKVKECKNVNFESNYAFAFARTDRGQKQYFGNEKYTYDGSYAYGGAIYTSENLDIVNNDNVVFNKNYVDGYNVCGGAIFSLGSLNIINNNAVTFSKNYEYKEQLYTSDNQFFPSYRSGKGSVVLRSIYMAPNSSRDNLILSAKTNGHITFYDSVYMAHYSDSVVKLNADYQDEEGFTKKCLGDIIFSGKYTEEHLKEIKGGTAGTASEIANSRTSELLNTVNLYGGTLRVEDKAVLKTHAINVVAGSNATMKVSDATVDATGYDIKVNDSAVLVIGGTDGSSTLIANNINIGAGATLSLTRTQVTTENDAKTLAAVDSMSVYNDQIAGVVRGNLSLAGGATLIADGAHLSMDGGILNFLATTENKTNLVLTLGAEYGSDSQIILFSDVDTAKFLQDSITATSNSSIVTLKASDYFTGEWVNDKTTLVYDSGNIYVSGVNIVVPEPTTATLSLLALVGLAARRRRK